MTFEHQITEKNDYLLIELSGRLMDKNAATELIEQVDELILEDKNRFIISGTELEYINSSGLSVLISILSKARKAGGEAVVCELSKKVKQLFIMTKLNTVYTVVDSREDAVEKIKQNQ